MDAITKITDENKKLGQPCKSFTRIPIYKLFSYKAQSTFSK
jgi:hypothetical protein